MNKSTAAIVWFVGFIAASIYVPTQIPINGFLWGFFGGILWTGLIIAFTKKDVSVEHPRDNYVDGPGVFVNGEPLDTLSDAEMAELYIKLKRSRMFHQDMGIQFKTESQAKQFMDYVRKKEQTI